MAGDGDGAPGCRVYISLREQYLLRQGPEVPEGLDATVSTQATRAPGPGSAERRAVEEAGSTRELLRLAERYTDTRPNARTAARIGEAVELSVLYPNWDNTPRSGREASSSRDRVAGAVSGPCTDGRRVTGRPDVEPGCYSSSRGTSGRRATTSSPILEHAHGYLVALNDVLRDT